jgi:5-formyltetrahydrofolate cyclo-ligase
MKKAELLRDEMRRIRDGIQGEERRGKSLAITEQIMSAPWYAGTECFFVYSAIRSEVDLSAFCDRAWVDKKLLFFPRVDGKSMDFYRVTEWGQLKKGSFGVNEPDISICPIAESEEINNAVLLAPGLAFSPDGYRIGYGGGFYDRYLERMNEIYPVGICFEAQLTQDFVPQAHDRIMREIITENHRHVR